MCVPRKLTSAWVLTCSLALDLPKMHSMQHFIPGIKLFGDANGYNTEIGERLHIDFAKDAYDATNKKKDQYLQQMCEWLECRERMNYLGHWHAHKNKTTFDPRKRPPDQRAHEPIEYAKEPAGGMCSFDDLSANHHAEAMPAALTEFLDDYCNDQWTAKFPNVPAPDFPSIRSSMRFPVWFNMKFYTPDLQTLGAKDTRDVAFAAPQRTRLSNDPDDPGLCARFSPVFIKNGEAAGDGGTEGQSRIAAVHLSCALRHRRSARRTPARDLRAARLGQGAARKSDA